MGNLFAFYLVELGYLVMLEFYKKKRIVSRQPNLYLTLNLIP